MDAEQAKAQRQRAASGRFEREDGKILQHYNARGTCLHTSLGALARAIGANGYRSQSDQR